MIAKNDRILFSKILCFKRFQTAWDLIFKDIFLVFNYSVKLERRDKN